MCQSSSEGYSLDDLDFICRTGYGDRLGAGWRGGGGTQKIHRWHPLGAVRFSGTCRHDK